MSIAENVQRVQARIRSACAAAGRDPADITLVAISKKRCAAEIEAAVAAGIQHIGENRVEEAETKIALLQAAGCRNITWHMVGHIQGRKARTACAHFDLLQSVDSLRLARRLSRAAADQQRELRILLQVNVSGEASKFGFEGYHWFKDATVSARLRTDVKEIVALPNLCIEGLMTMAPLGAGRARVRSVFADLCRLRDELQQTLGMALPALSMGMTDDFEWAIQEGSTMIRVGRAIFDVH